MHWLNSVVTQVEIASYFLSFWGFHFIKPALNLEKQSISSDVVCEQKRKVWSSQAEGVAGCGWFECKDCLCGQWNRFPVVWSLDWYADRDSMMSQVVSVSCLQSVR